METKTEFYLWIDEAIAGPHYAQEVVEMLNSGAATWETQAHTGTGEWQRLGDYKDAIISMTKHKPISAPVTAGGANRRPATGPAYQGGWRQGASGCFFGSVVLIVLGIGFGAGWLAGMGGGLFTLGWWFLLMDRLDVIADLMRRK